MKDIPRPTTLQLKAELQRMRRKREYRYTLRSTIYILITVAAAAVLVATLFLPVLQVTGTSMEPTLETGEIVVAVKNSQFQPGDIVAFYYNNKVLLKRVVGTAGDKITIDKTGNVFVNNELLEERYLTEKSLGESDIQYPYQVPDGRIFVLGDHRETSIDSRSTAVGCIADEFVVGKVEVRIWPLSRFAFMDKDMGYKYGH